MTGCTVYNSIGSSTGAYISEPDGQAFKPVGYRWDYEYSALLYIYRPGSEWADDELESPSFYVNDEHLFNLKSRGYTWYELDPGEYDIVMRRPLFGIEGLAVTDFFDFSIKTPGQASLNVKAGKVYFLRYSEVDPIQLEVDETDPLAEVNDTEDNFLQLVPETVALAELPQMRMLDEGRGRLAPQDEKDEPIAEPTYRETGADAPGTKSKAKSAETKEEQWWPF